MLKRQIIISRQVQWLSEDSFYTKDSHIIFSFKNLSPVYLMRVSHIILTRLCYQCIYNKTYKGDYSLEKSTCSKFNDRYSDLCRMDEKMCGKEGKYFITKDKESEQN